MQDCQGRHERYTYTPLRDDPRNSTLLTLYSRYFLIPPSRPTATICDNSSSLRAPRPQSPTMVSNMSLQADLVSQYCQKKPAPYPLRSQHSGRCTPTVPRTGIKPLTMPLPSQSHRSQYPISAFPSIPSIVACLVETTLLKSKRP